MQLRFELVAEDARSGIAGRAGDRPAAERAVDVDRAAGDHFRAGGDGAEDGHVALREYHRLAGADRLVVHERSRTRRQRRGCGHGGGSLAFPATSSSLALVAGGALVAAGGVSGSSVVAVVRLPALTSGGMPETEEGRLRPLNAHDADVALAQVGEELRKPLLVERQRCDVEDDRPARRNSRGISSTTRRARGTIPRGAASGAKTSAMNERPRKRSDFLC